MSNLRFHCIGLTGGIGAGKSTVAKYLRDAGIPVLNLDDIGREVTESDPSLVSKINTLCGIKSSAFDRKRVKEALFQFPAVRTAVEGLLHPIILKAFEEKARQLKEKGEKLIICEAALLVESGFHSAMDELIVVCAPEKLRRDRLMKRDHVDANLADRILSTQASEDRKRSLAHYVIENDKTESELKTQINNLIKRWKDAGWL